MSDAPPDGMVFKAVLGHGIGFVQVSAIEDGVTGHPLPHFWKVYQVTELAPLGVDRREVAPSMASIGVRKYWSLLPYFSLTLAMASGSWTWACTRG
ncbi:MAG: hypothetical protein U0894_03200 [Pirellulales bacterium]